MPQLLQLKLLGGFDLSQGGKSLTGATTERLQSLLTYLVLNQHAPQARQHLAFLFWSDSNDAQARTNLRRAIHHLRRILPDIEQFIAIDAKALQWRHDAPAIVDVLEFEQAIAEAEAAAQSSDLTALRLALERATGLYQGKLLPHCGEEWIELEQERLHQACVRAYTWLIQCLQEQQDYNAALRYAQQLLRLDALNEVAYAHLMQLYALNGDRANALQTYHRCMTVLREELGVDPSATTRKLYERLLLEDEAMEDEATAVPASCHSPSFSSTMRAKCNAKATPSMRPVSPLIGREREWAMIQEWTIALQAPAQIASATDQAEVLLVLGEPGIGKTRLLEELRSQMQANQVLWGRGFAAEMVRPYGIWTDALRSTVIPGTLSMPPELGFLLPEIGQPGKTPSDRSYWFDAVVQLLGAWANQTPLVVILDDLQWIDEASSALLHYAIRLLRHLPVRFACAARSGELADNPAIARVIQALRREQRLRTLELHPFDRGQTADLLRTAQAVEESSLSLEVVDQVFSDSGGNPLFALEVARALSHNRTAHTDTLEALIRDRLQQLDSSARDLLPWAAALGRSFKPTVLAQVSDYALPQLLSAIGQLEQQTIIRPSVFSSNELGNELGYDFVHDIVRQVVYRQLSEPRRQLVHWQIAHKLNQHLSVDSALAGDVAHHASLGGDDELAATTALFAAERCLKLFAYTEATTLAHLGIQHCQRLADRPRIRLHLGLLRVLAIAGVTGDRATQLEFDVYRLISEASQLGLKDDEALGQDALGVLYFNQNNFVEMHPHLLRSIEISRAASPATAARLLASTGSCLAEIGRDMARAEALLLEAQSLADRVGLQLCDIDSGLGSLHYHNGRYDEARTLLQQALRLTQIEQDHWRECTYLSYLAMTELESGDPAAALPYCEEMEVVAAKIQGEGSEGAIAAALKALVHYRLQQSRSDDDLARAITTLQHVDAKRMLSYVLIGAAEVDLARDRSQLAVVRAETALQAAQVLNHLSEIALARAILIQGLWAVGNPAQAMAQLEVLQTQLDRQALSARARAVVDRVAQQMQKRVVAVSLRASKKR